MKNLAKSPRMAGTLLAIALMLALVVCAPSTAKAQTFNSAGELKQYLDKQPANGPDKPIRVSMGANDLMIKDIAAAIKSSGKYVSLELTGSALTSIGRLAFDNCVNLASITIPNSVTSIGVGAFQNCTSLARINIPNGVTSIEGYTFYKCTRLASITIPNGVTSIGNMAFSGCASLASVNIPNGVTNIEKNSFGGCASLASIIIPNGVKIIGQSAFLGCTRLTNVTIPASVTSIESWAFTDCISLASVTFQSTIAPGKFGNSFDFSDIVRPFDGDLRDKYLAGGIGTYTRPYDGETWTKNTSAISTGTAQTRNSPEEPETDFKVLRNANNTITITEYTGSATELVSCNIQLTQ